MKLVTRVAIDLIHVNSKEKRTIYAGEYDVARVNGIHENEMWIVINDINYPHHMFGHTEKEWDKIIQESYGNIGFVGSYIDMTKLFNIVK